MTISIPNDGLRGLAPVEPRRATGKAPNVQHQHFHGFMGGATYELAIVEFDDQGRCYDRGQMDGLATRIDQLRAAEADVILLVFTHGWKHDARTDDEDLSAFRKLLTATVVHEHATTTSGAVPRQVLGIFVGWRGLSAFGGPGDVRADLTFWRRQQAGHRVATGSVRELFGRLRHYRNHRLKKENASPLLVIAGHSFGGLIVFSALAQSLIEAASAPSGDLVPSFADLVLLVNPAIEGARYLPIRDLVCSPAFKARTVKQLPVFVCVQAKNDKPVGVVFPLANYANRFEQATIGDVEKACVNHAIGFIPSFQTHTLAGPKTSNPFELTPPDPDELNPFWVVHADKAVIDGHGGIWQKPFMNFLASIVFQHVQASKGGGGPGGPARSGRPVSNPPPGGPGGGGGAIESLAAYARVVAPF